MGALSETATGHPASNAGSPVRDGAEFSILPGGPLFRLLVGVRLAGPSLERLPRRILAVCAVAWLPLLVLTPKLFHAKQEGLLRYGALAERYVREFDAKWLRGRSGDDEGLLGAADIQSLADLGHSFSVVRNMQLFAFSMEVVLILGVVSLAPVAPLLLTMIPPGELLERLAKLLL